MQSFDTIITKDGKHTYHGKVVSWFTHDEFNFVPQGGSVINPWWCKMDHYNLYIDSKPIFGKICLT